MLDSDTGLHILMIAVCLYRLVMMSINLSKKFTLHLQMVTVSAGIIVTQLLHNHMPMLYCMQPLNFIWAFNDKKYDEVLSIANSVFIIPSSASRRQGKTSTCDSRLDCENNRNTAQ